MKTQCTEILGDQRCTLPTTHGGKHCVAWGEKKHDSRKHERLTKWTEGACYLLPMLLEPEMLRPEERARRAYIEELVVELNRVTNDKSPYWMYGETGSRVKAIEDKIEEARHVPVSTIIAPPEEFSEIGLQMSISDAIKKVRNEMADIGPTTEADLDISDYIEISRDLLSMVIDRNIIDQKASLQRAMVKIAAMAQIVLERIGVE